MTSDAFQTLHEVERLRRRTRSQLQTAWFPFLLWGLLVLLGIAARTLDEAAVAPYWLAAAPAGTVATAFYYHRRERALGLVAGDRLPWLVLTLMVSGAIVSAFVGPEMLRIAGPPISIGLGLIVLGWLERYALVVAVGVASVLLGVALAPLGDAAQPYGFAAWGAALALTGVVLRRAETHSGGDA